MRPRTLAAYLAALILGIGLAIGPRAWAAECPMLALEARDPRAREAFDFLRSVYGDTSPQGFYKKILRKIRNEGVFHYTFPQGSLSGLPPEAELIVTAAAAESRYLLTDLWTRALLQKLLGPDPAEFRKALEKALKLGVLLGRAVDFILIDVLEKQRASILERRRRQSLEIAPWVPG